MILPAHDQRRWPNHGLWLPPQAQCPRLPAPLSWTEAGHCPQCHSASRPSLPYGCGEAAAGRGMTILPAWMTVNKDGLVHGGVAEKGKSPPKVSSPAAMVPKIHDPNHKEEVAAAVARSSGGANLLPAWMTSGDGPTMGSATTSSSVSALPAPLSWTEAGHCP